MNDENGFEPGVLERLEKIHLLRAPAAFAAQYAQLVPTMWACGGCRRVD